MENTKTVRVLEIQKEIETQVANKEVMNALVTTTFKGLEVGLVKRAIMEGMMRGFNFTDFLEKNVYAIPFKDSYSLVTSVDYARKVGMRSGVVGKSAPTFVEKDGKIISCSVTIAKKFGAGVPFGEFTATVFFAEYTTGRNLWTTKPRTMIAKVAEMHALRMACPEELSKAFVEEEMATSVPERPAIVVGSYKTKLEGAKNLEDLKKIWSAMPMAAKKDPKMVEIKDNLKKTLK